MTRDEFWSGPVWPVANAMMRSGNQPGIIKQWVASAYQWALDNRGPDAGAIKAWVPHFQPRPFYTAAELTPMWPALVAAMGLPFRNVNYSPGRLANALDYAKLPLLIRDDGGVWFRDPARPGEESTYYIVEQVHYWKKRHLSQEEFEDAYYTIRPFT